ncbi:MAG TPA: tryptophan synthase subunit alpha [Candidatus Dormibacteraeota bacterium]|nr:tryptophan synthase subunit alpha [Candidatus Dormibacteraeota bacterium]
MQNNSYSDSAIEQKFRELGNRAEGVIVAYLVGNDPDPKSFLANAASLIEGGADILEIGIPFSDPVADGPVIQAAGTRALSAGATPRKIFDAVGELSSQFTIPIVIMTYYNLILAMGIEQFIRNASDNGVKGIVVPDLPMEEGDGFRDIALKHNLDNIYLAAPNTSAERLRTIVEKSKGFLYLISLYGVTGPRDTVSAESFETVKKVKSLAKGKIPISAGFGISQAEHVSSLLRAGADGAIVGSVLVRTVADHLNDPEAAPYYLKKTITVLKQASRQRPS